MYRIGEFSYLFQVSQKTLRHYDRLGLFVPSYVDPFTGYRYYSDEQIDEFEKIVRLKNLNFSLDEIKTLKDELDEEVILQKIKTLEEEQKNLADKIVHLKKLNECGEDNMKYEMGMTYHVKMKFVGKRVVVKKRTDEFLTPVFEEIEEKLKRLNIISSTKVIITEEVGYKEEEVELFIGYQFGSFFNKRTNVYYSVHKYPRKYVKFLKKACAMGLEFFEYPTVDYFVAIDVDRNDVNNACKDMIKYSSANKIQLLGPFIEVYDLRENKLNIYVLANDLKKEVDIIDKIRDQEFIARKKVFVNDDRLLGKWKIKEILPDIHFNPNHQKSVPVTKYEYLEILENGQTNYENINWSKDWLFTKFNNNETISCVKFLNIDGKEYLEIRMSDMSEVYENAMPMSYIYERV